MNFKTFFIALGLAFVMQATTFASVQTVSFHPGHGHGHHHHKVSCSARNIRGQIFSAVGFDAISTQNRALNLCQSRSLSCTSLGCSYLF